jgi:hypothetical protein
MEEQQDADTAAKELGIKDDAGKRREAANSEESARVDEDREKQGRDVASSGSKSRSQL